MAAVLEVPNNRRYLHKNNIYFPKENRSVVSVVSLLQYSGGVEHIYT